MAEGWYYLHSNGNLIYEPGPWVGPFEYRLWPAHTMDREAFWSMLVEALAAGAHEDRVFELATKDGCDDKDAQEYAERVGCKLGMDGNMWCATRQDFENLQESPAGFGKTALEAMAALCKELGNQLSNLYTFKHLLTAPLPKADKL